MSADNIEVEAEITSHCASCGITENDDVDLKECDGCDLVKYCSDKCQKNHWSQHKQTCWKRAAELSDELLFTQPESSHLGDCPICFLPLPLDRKRTTIMACCSKVICYGCAYANTHLKREVEQRLAPKCPFCREPTPKTDEECDKLRMKRIKANGPEELIREGFKRYEKGDYSGAFEYYSKAAQLGTLDAHYHLACLFHEEDFVERDRGKEMYHLGKAAIGGHPEARHHLGCNELNNGNTERAVKHYIIAARQGDDRSIKALLDAFKGGRVGKNDLASALRAHQAAVDATKSPQREAAESFRRILDEM